MELSTVRLDFPRPDCNVIVGQAHFIKTVEDLHEILAGGSPHLKFGVAFCEASGDRLIRWSGNDPDLCETARGCARAISCGHVFVVVIREGFPINVLNAIKACPEVATVFCATSNPVEVIVAESTQGRGVIGVVDGSPPIGVEGDRDIIARKSLLRKFGYKLS